MDQISENLVGVIAFVTAETQELTILEFESADALVEMIKELKADGMDFLLAEGIGGHLLCKGKVPEPPKLVKKKKP